MKFFKNLWTGFWEGWNGYIRQMAQGQYLHILPILASLAPALAGAAGKALGGGKGDLLSSILGGLGGLGEALGQEDAVRPEEEYKEREKYETNMMNKRRQMFKDEGLKPQTPRYEIQKDLGIFDPMIKSAVMGSFRDIFGADTVARWGMDFDTMKKVAGERQVAQEQQATPQEQLGQPKFMEDGMAFRGRGDRGRQQMEMQ